MSLTNRQKIAHLMRRFALGATESDLDRLEPIGVEGTIEFLLNENNIDEAFPISPWEFCQETDKTEIYLDGYRFSSWWALRLLMSHRPAEQKLTFFWHNHFAVSGEKVEFGPMLLTYLETLRSHAFGDFSSLLKAISRDPAMLHYLDGDTSVRDHPNENFAREFFELFTVSKGNYTENDIHEAARSFTGWAIRYLVYEDPGQDFQEKVRNCIARNIPMVTSSFSPDLFDDGAKNIFGKSVPYTADSLIDEIALKPQTAYYITQKLWHFFAGTEIPARVANRLATLFIKTNGNTKSILREIAKTEEFWAEDCVRHLPKSPLEFVVSVLRQAQLQPIMTAMHGKGATPTTPLAKPLRDTAGLILVSMQKQGMVLLFPPNVGGWNLGKAWITPNNMLARAEFANLIFGVGQPDQPLAAYIAKQILDSNPITSYNTIVKFLSMFDADLPASKQYLLIQAFEKEGGLPSLKTPSGASRTLGAVARLLFASPEFQFC